MGKKIVLENVSKTYKKKKQEIKVLNDISVTFETGKMYAIMGSSGSGKTTLFNIIGLLDSKYSGNYKIFDENVSEKKDKDLACLRMNNIGFIFQDFLLDPYLKSFENVMMPLYINKNVSKHERKEKAIEYLKKFNLEDRIEHYPSELSGGEQQRIAIARALINNPIIILADEPTGNLDEENQKEIFALLKKLSEEDKCVIVVSHTSEIKKYADVIYKLENGKLRME